MKSKSENDFKKTSKKKRFGFTQLNVYEEKGELSDIFETFEANGCNS
jgi:hypothetical protein